MGVSEAGVVQEPLSYQILSVVIWTSPPETAVQRHLAGSSDDAGRLSRSGAGCSLTRSDVVLAWGPRLRLGPVPGSSRGQPGFPHWPDFKLYEGYADGGHGGCGR